MDSDSSDSSDSDRLLIDEDYFSTPTNGQSPSASPREKSPPTIRHEKSQLRSTYENSALESINGDTFSLTSSYEKSSLASYNKQCPLTSSKTGSLQMSNLFGNGSSISANELFAIMATNGPFLPLAKNGVNSPPSRTNDDLPIALTRGNVPLKSTPAPPKETAASYRGSSRVHKTRHKRSLTEGNQSANSRARIYMYKKFQNLPEDVAEIKRLKLNEMERDRQRKLCDAFTELKGLNMPNIPVDEGYKSDSKYHLLRCALSFIKKLKQENAGLEMKLSMAYLMQLNSKTTRDQATQTGSVHINNAKGGVLENGESPKPADSRMSVRPKGQSSRPKVIEHFFATREERFGMPKSNEYVTPRTNQHAMPNATEHFLAPRTDQGIMHLAARTEPEMATSSSERAATGNDEDISSKFGQDVKVDINIQINDSLSSTSQLNYFYKTDRNPRDTQAWTNNSSANNRVSSASLVTESNFPQLACYAKKFYAYNNITPPMHPDDNPSISLAHRPGVEPMFYPPNVGVRINAGSVFQNPQGYNTFKSAQPISYTLNTSGYAYEGTPSTSSSSQQNSTLDTSISGSDFETTDTRPFSLSIGIPAKSRLHNANFDTSNESEILTREVEDKIHLANAHHEAASNIGVSHCDILSYIQPCSPSLDHSCSFSQHQRGRESSVQDISAMGCEQPGTYSLLLQGGFNHMASGCEVRCGRPTTLNHPRYIKTSQQYIKTSLNHSNISAVPRHSLNLKMFSHSTISSPHHTHIQVTPRHPIDLKISTHITKTTPE